MIRPDHFLVMKSQSQVPIAAVAMARFERLARAQRSLRPLALGDVAEDEARGAPAPGSPAGRRDREDHIDRGAVLRRELELPSRASPDAANAARISRILGIESGWHNPSIGRPRSVSLGSPTAAASAGCPRRIAPCSPAPRSPTFQATVRSASPRRRSETAPLLRRAPQCQVKRRHEEDGGRVGEPPGEPERECGAHRNEAAQRGEADPVRQAIPQGRMALARNPNHPARARERTSQSHESLDEPRSDERLRVAPQATPVAAVSASAAGNGPEP